MALNIYRIVNDTSYSGTLLLGLTSADSDEELIAEICDNIKKGEAEGQFSTKNMEKSYVMVYKSPIPLIKTKELYQNLVNLYTPDMKVSQFEDFGDVKQTIGFSDSLDWEMIGMVNTLLLLNDYECDKKTKAHLIQIDNNIMIADAKKSIFSEFETLAGNIKRMLKNGISYQTFKGHMKCFIINPMRANVSDLLKTMADVAEGNRSITDVNALCQKPIKKHDIGMVLLNDTLGNKNDRTEMHTVVLINNAGSPITIVPDKDFEEIELANRLIEKTNLKVAGVAKEIQMNNELKEKVIKRKIGNIK